MRGGKTAASGFKFELPSGKVIKGPYYSKYSKSRDKATKSTGYNTHKIGMPARIASKYAHVSDGELRKNMYAHMGKSRPSSKGSKPKKRSSRNKRKKR